MKPILFNTEMVRAILDGRKTMTRRVLKHQPKYAAMTAAGLITSENPITIEDGLVVTKNGDVTTWDKLPYRPGDILYVRETWYYESFYEDNDAIPPDLPSGKCSWRYEYKATSPDYPVAPGHWRPSIHMPKEAARLFLRVKEVRVERLQESFFKPGVTVLACQAEGIDIGDQCRECIDNYGNPVCIDENDGDDEEECECGILDDIRAEFSDLWDSTIKPIDRTQYGWVANPWVWVIEFERISREEAQ